MSETTIKPTRIAHIRVRSKMHELLHGEQASSSMENSLVLALVALGTTSTVSSAAVLIHNVIQIVIAQLNSVWPAQG